MTKKIVLMLLVVLSLSSCGVAIRSANRVANNAVEAVDKLTDANKVIGDYQWYEDTYQEIRAMIQNYKVAKQSLDMYEGEARDRRLIEINGMMAIINTRIGEYNSRSKQITRNLWKSSTLPQQLNWEEF